VKRKIYAKKIKDFWEEYKRNKIGLAGIIIILLFVFAAFSAPLLTPYKPIKDYDLAESMAMPQWMTLFPQYHDLPPTINLSLNWPNTLYNQSLVNITRNNELVVQYIGTEMNADVSLSMNFSYPNSPPKTFKCAFRWSAKPVTNVGYSLELFLVLPGGENISLWDSYYRYNEKQKTEIPLRTMESSSAVVQLHSKDTRMFTRFGYTTPLQQLTHNLANETFAVKGEYSLLMCVRFRPKATNATCEIHMSDAEFMIPGLVHGVLGTDNDGADVFSQLVYGIQIALAIGLLAALMTTVIGVVAGVVAGYIGGVVDEILMRTVDVLISIPLLPLQLTLVFMLGRNVFFIVLLIGFFFWTGLARIIRAQVLYLREMAFIESAKTAGASRSHIIFKHVIPNVLPIATASLVLNIPVAILTEAALSFLGFGDPTLATWGRMLNNAFLSEAFKKLAWWWIVPPGLAIMVLCLAFMFIGHALDEIVNPRLRKRR
jgi:peptide/nickel transport system permease protein